jgi:hypothetical protein
MSSWQTTRWPIIRHVRYFYLKARFIWWWETYCAGLFMCPQKSDLDYLEAVWRGEA